MSEDKLSFLDEPKDAPTPEPTPPPQAEPDKAEAAPPAQADELPEEKSGKVRDPETGRYVPPGLLEERRKRQELERRLEAIEAERAQPRPEPPQEGTVEWVQHLNAEQERVRWNDKLDTSEMLARQHYGEDIVTEAQQAFMDAVRADPALYGKLQEARHPYDFVVKWHKQQALLTEVGQDPDAWRKAERERLKEELLKELGVQGVTPPGHSSQQPPPTSIVGRPAAAKAGTVPIGPGNAFDSIF